ncbi:MAG: GNAT family N-acetyltransferase [Caulobacterales bacterium]|uniref:GNAT family N-acetyltransferase n=1 Tax=Glycocaulis sp. TaxID=1969725 RepID=UPI003FA18EEF
MHGSDTVIDWTRPLNGERVMLRLLKLEDSGWISHGTTNRKVTDMTGRIPYPNPPLGAELYVLTCQAAEANRGDRVRAIIRKADGAGMGMIGLHPRKDGAVEFGYWLGEPYWGQGYATEAAKLLLDAADADGIAPIVAGHYADNPASGRVLEKMGFAYTGEVPRAFSSGRLASAPCPRMLRRQG